MHGRAFSRTFLERGREIEQLRKRPVRWPITLSKPITESPHDFAVGGKTPMFGEQAAESETENGQAGHTADPTAKDDAPGKKFATGGSGKMFGFNPSVPAQSGITSAR